MVTRWLLVIVLLLFLAWWIINDISTHELLTIIIMLFWLLSLAFAVGLVVELNCLQLKSHCNGTSDFSRWLRFVPALALLLAWHLRAWQGDVVWKSEWEVNNFFFVRKSKLDARRARLYQECWRFVNSHWWACLRRPSSRWGGNVIVEGKSVPRESFYPGCLWRCRLNRMLAFAVWLLRVKPAEHVRWMMNIPRSNGVK